MSTIKMYLLALVISLTLLVSSCASPSTPTPALEPEPTDPASNDVLISFIINASDGMDELSACLAARDVYRFVLYEDDRLIRFDGMKFVETRIGQTEIDELLSEIETTGFTSLFGDGDQYTQDASTPSFIDPWGGCIMVNEKTITITPGQSDYLVEPVIRTLDIIENYNPENSERYKPQSASLYVFLNENIVLGTANPTPEPPVLNWSVDQIDLNDFLIDPATSKPQVLSGDSLSFLMEQFQHLPALRRVEQNGQTYLIVLYPNIP